MNEYHARRAKQLNLYELYHRWYNDATASNHRNITLTDSFRSIFKDEPRILKMGCRLNSISERKKMLYKEIRRLTTLRKMAWRRYQNHLRFNLFCISAYRKTRVDVSFARHAILEYLHGRVLKTT